MGGSDPSVFKASPAIANGELYMSSDRFLFCVSEKGSADLATIAKEEAKLPKEGESYSVQVNPAKIALQGGRGPNSVSLAGLLNSLDEDNDEKLSQEELADSSMPKFLQALMFRLGDVNHDGFIDADERIKLDTTFGKKQGAVAGRKNASRRPLRPGDPLPPGEIPDQQNDNPPRTKEQESTKPQQELSKTGSTDRESPE